MMQPLRSVLAALAERPDVAGAALVSDEGLVVEAALPSHIDPEAVAALAATATRNLAVLSETLGAGAAQQVVADGESGTFVLQRLPSGSTLLVIARPEGDLGTLLYDLRRHSPALISLV